MTWRASRSPGPAAVLALLLATPMGWAQEIPATSTLFAGPRFIDLQYVVGLASGDFDGDGLSDLAVAHFDTAWLLRSLGDGAVEGFEYPHSEQGSLRALVVLDWNGDGHLDMGVARSFGPLLALLGDGTGGPLGVLDPLGVPDENLTLSAGDLDGDGQVDLVVGQALPNRLLALLGDGAGGVATQAATPTDDVVIDLELTDLDADGDLDAVGLHTDFADGRLWTWLGDGTGGFTLLETLEPAPQSSEVKVGDVHGDGFPDLVTRANGPDRIWLWPNQGDGTLGPPVVPDVPSARGALLADLDGDGQDDLLASNNSGSDVLVFRSDGVGGFADPTSLEACDDPSTLYALDLDGDGLLDLAVTGSLQAGGLTLHTGVGTGGLRLPSEVKPGGILQGLAVEDMDGDGWLDAVTASFLTNQVFVVRGTGTDQLGVAHGYPIGGSPSDVAVGDVTADGSPDVVVAVGEIAGGVALLANDGSGSLGPAAFHAAGATISVALEDMDQDGVTDVLALNKGAAKLSLLRADGLGGLGAPDSWPTGFQPRDLAAGDLDGDTVPDVVVVAEGDTEMTVLIGRGGGSGDLDLGTPVDVGATNSWGVDLGDVDLDGDLDVALVLLQNDRLRIFDNDGAAGFVLVHNLPTVDRVAALRVFDGDLDGEPDVVTAGLNSLGFHRGRDLVGFFPVSRHHAIGGTNTNVSALAVADLEGSGFSDVLTVSSSGRLSVVPNRGSPWWRLDGGVAGGPVLSPVGALTPGSALDLDAWNGSPGGTLWLVLGLTTETLPFAGGTLVPAPDVLLPLPLDGAGELHLPLVWPNDLPPGIPFWLQPWLASPHTPGDALLGVTR
jgi:hypothetical protein